MPSSTRCARLFSTLVSSESGRSKLHSYTSGYFVSLSIALPRGKDCRWVLVHMRSRFQRFAAMSTVGNLASPCHVQCPDAERAAARPFVVAFRTCAENKLRAAQEFVAFAKRDQEPAIPVRADQEFFQDRIPFAIGRF